MVRQNRILDLLHGERRLNERMVVTRTKEEGADEGVEVVVEDQGPGGFGSSEKRAGGPRAVRRAKSGSRGRVYNVIFVQDSFNGRTGKEGSL